MSQPKELTEFKDGAVTGCPHFTMSAFPLIFNGKI